MKVGHRGNRRTVGIPEAGRRIRRRKPVLRRLGGFRQVCGRLWLAVVGLAYPAAAQQASAPFDLMSEMETAAALQKWVDADPNLSKEIRREMMVFTAGYAAYAPKMGMETAETVGRIFALAQAQQFKFYPETYTFLKAQWYIDTAHYAWNGAWLGSVEQTLLQHKIRDFSRLTERTLALLTQRQMSASTRATWMVTAGEPVWNAEAGTRGVFHYDDATLRCTAYNDSSLIRSAYGDYDPLAQTFQGTSGEVDWRRIGKDGEQIRAEIYDYKLNVNSNRYETDSAVFYNTALYQDPIPGRFVEKLSVLTTPEAATYPQFHSGNARLHLPEFFPGLDVEAPYVQQGGRMVFGTEDHAARLVVRNGEQVLGVLESSRIVYKDGKLQSAMASWCVYLGESDSMYHQTSEMRYDIKQQVFSFSHSQLFAFEIPALSTYHQIGLQYENMQWYPFEGRVEIGILHVPEREGVVRMTSLQAYEDAELEKIMEGMPYNPLYRLKQYADRYGSGLIRLDDLASAWGMDQTVLSQWMLRLSSFGFLTYRAKEKEVELLPKLYLYLAVSANKSDFDRIEILSSGKAWVKAELRMDSLRMSVREVEEVVLSPKQRVYFRPDGGVLSIGRNRSLYFDGLLHAGTFDFDVRNARFSYDDFMVEIGMVDSLLFSVPGEADEFGMRQEVKVSTLIHNLSGLLHIDSNVNKGGRLDCPDYPIFESTIPAYVYYDDADIQGGAYPADSFYFEVDPFRLLRLNTFAIDSIHFDGTLVSAGIFPDIRERLVVMPDFSLGFKTVSPAEGWPVYGGLARFTDSVRLDRKGLVGKGRFDFLASQTHSAAQYYRPKDMDMIAERFEQDMTKYPVANGKSYPYLTADSVKGFFDAEKGTYQLSTTSRHSLYPYYDPWRFDGRYVFSDEGTAADGEMVFGHDARIKASDWRWDGQLFWAEDADFQLGGRAGGRNAYLIAKGVGISGDVEAKHLQMQAAGTELPTEPVAVRMPVQAYEAEAYRLHWSWADEQLYLEQQLSEALRMKPAETVSDLAADAAVATDLSAAETDSAGLVLHATAKSQADLQFNALHSTLYYKDTLMVCEGVSGLRVADAYWMPAEDRVTVLPNGHLEAFEDAVLYFSEAYPAYEFHQVSGRIESAWSYEADGWYSYETPGLEPQPVHFGRIHVRKSDSTSEATATLDDEYLFLDEGFEFSGKLTASAKSAAERESPDLYFDGLAGMRYRLLDEAAASETSSEVASGTADESEEASGGDWFASAFRFQSYLNPAQIMIPVTEQTRSGRGRPMRAGFFSGSDGRPHFVFMEPVLSTEKPIASAEGFLCYSDEDKAYLIVDDNETEILAYDLKSGESSATGDLQLNLRTDDLKTAFYGQLFQEGGSADDLFMQVVWKLDFFFSAPLFKRMADELNKNTNLMAGNLSDNPMFDVFLQETMTPQEAEAVRNEVQTYGSVNRIPSEWQKGLVFSNLGFEWDPMSSSYRSTGSGELLLVGSHWVNKKMKVYARISRGRRGDVLDIYIEGSRYNWYYFNYADRKMQVLSSDQGFNEAVDKLKASKRRKGRFEFMLSTMRKKNIFVAEFEDAGLYDEPETPTSAEGGLDETAGETYDGYDGYEDWTDEGDWEEAEGAEEAATTDGTAEEDGTGAEAPEEETDEVSAEDDGYSDEEYPDDEYWEEDAAE